MLERNSAWLDEIGPQDRNRAFEHLQTIIRAGVQSGYDERSTLPEIQEMSWIVIFAGKNFSKKHDG